MKNLLTTFCFLTLYLIAPAQDKEFTGGINTGFFSFRGKSAVNTSFINVSDVTSIPNYTNDIYSKKAGAGIGINFSLQKVTKAKIIYGLSAAIEILKSKISIDAVAGVRGSSGVANGKVTLTSKFVSISPALGYRFAFKKLSLDVEGVLDFAICVAPHHEKGSATTTDSPPGTFSTNKDRNKTGLDFRTGLQSTLNYQRYGLLAGFWIGHSNYYKGMIGADLEAYSKLIRLGITYRLNK